MKRRSFVKRLASVAVIAAAVKVNAAGSSADWHRIADEANTFGPHDTVQTRLRKFNELTGAGLSFAWIDLDGRYVRTNKFYGENHGGRRCLVFQDGKGTGYMDREAFLHWTAQVGLGYRIAKAQASQ